MRYLLIVAMLWAGTGWAGEYRVVTNEPIRGKEMLELVDAAEGVLPYLRASYDPIPMSVTLEYRPPLTPIEQLEKEIRDIRERDAAIKRFREALKRAKGG